MLLFEAELGVRNVTPMTWLTQKRAAQVPLKEGCAAQPWDCGPANDIQLSAPSRWASAASSQVLPFPRQPESNDCRK